jgi:hypothetical protein
VGCALIVETTSSQLGECFETSANASANASYDQKAIEGHLRADRRATAVVRATRRNRKGTRNRNGKRGGQVIGTSWWESLPPTLCVDALGGHLARRWGALLRLCACPALVIKRDCSYISIHFSLEIAEISLPIASSGKSSGDSK